MLKQVLWFFATWLSLFVTLTIISLVFWGFVVVHKVAGLAFVGAVFWRAMDWFQSRRKRTAT